MFTRKNTLISVAVLALLAGCGGGGGDSPSTSGGGSTNTSTGTGTGTNAPAATTDQKLANTMVLANDHVAGVYGGQATAIGYANYTSNTPGVNQAFGNAGYGAFGMDKGTNAPIKGFGYRVRFAGTDGVCTAESRTGRIAYELKDQSTVAQGKVLQMMIDKVTINKLADCSFTVSQAADSRVYVYAKNAAGQAGNGSAVAPANAVTLTPSGDGESSYLMVDVDAIVGAAKSAATGTNAQALASAAGFTSGETVPFESALTISTVNMTRQAGAALAGKAITVTNSGVAGVADGGGVAKGYIQVVE